MNITIIATPLYNPRDNSLKRIRVVKLVNGIPTQGYMAIDVMEARAIYDSMCYLNRKYDIQRYWGINA
jgi:hypothetical protein